MSRELYSAYIRACSNMRRCYTAAECWIWYLSPALQVTCRSRKNFYGASGLGVVVLFGARIRICIKYSASVTTLLAPDLVCCLYDKLYHNFDSRGPASNTFSRRLQSLRVSAGILLLLSPRLHQPLEAARTATPGLHELSDTLLLFPLLLQGSSNSSVLCLETPDMPRLPACCTHRAA